MQQGSIGTVNEFNAYIVRYVIGAYNERNQAALQEMGLTPAQLTRLKNMTMDAMVRFCGFNAPVANVSFVGRHLDLMMDHAEREGARDIIIDQCIMMEASQAMLEELAGVDRNEFRKRRTFLGLPQAGSGRPHALTEEQALQVYNSWRRHKSERDALNLYYYLGLDTGLPLSEVWTHMKTNEKELLADNNE